MQRSLLVLFPLLFLWGCVSTTNINKDNGGNNQLQNLACGEAKKGGGESPWHIANLYDCQKNRLYIPYQLWTGAKWNGNKDSSCMHDADSTFWVNNSSGTTIKGPKEWKNPETGENLSVWVRAKIDGSKEQYFTCHKKGIGRVYDSRKSSNYETGRCKFPAGYGWKVGKRRGCDSTAIDITNLEFDENHNLLAINFNYWVIGYSGSYVLDHKYRYVPNIGMTNAWKQ
ncbi:MAG: hypothetical protein HQL69_02360 [Magnetococcales bacterium]|nr:hypothetical protein [Magnetococcales bacterium]